MIAFLDGPVIEATRTYVVILTGGIGYRVETTANAAPLWIHAITKETGTTLYGFASQPQRALFVALLEVDGVGPAKAQAIVESGVSVADADALCAVKGIGLKTAAKIAGVFA